MRKGTHVLITNEDEQVEVFCEMNSLGTRGTSWKTGRGLEMTGHAIEYLYAAELLDIWPYSKESRFEALDILKRSNREIWYSRPVIVPFSDRIIELMVRLLDAILPD